MVGGIYVIDRYIRIGKVSFETIPFRIFLQFLALVSGKKPQKFFENIEV